jgi:hypothetical protein
MVIQGSHVDQEKWRLTGRIQRPILSQADGPVRFVLKVDGLVRQNPRHRDG